MMEAFSKASEYCEVGLWVKASNLRKEACVLAVGGGLGVGGADVPSEGDLDVVLVDGEPEVEELQLAIVAIQQVPPRGAVLARAPHVLTQAVQGGTLVGVALRVVAVRLADVGLERLYPVDLVGLLQGHRDHGYEGRHGGGIGAWRGKHGPASSSSSSSLEEAGCAPYSGVGGGGEQEAIAGGCGWVRSRYCRWAVPRR